MDGQAERPPLPAREAASLGDAFFIAGSRSFI
jgi:hypothetical protein